MSHTFDEEPPPGQLVFGGKPESARAPALRAFPLRQRNPLGRDLVFLLLAACWRSAVRRENLAVAGQGNLLGVAGFGERRSDVLGFEGH